VAAAVSAAVELGVPPGGKAVRRQTPIPSPNTINFVGCEALAQFALAVKMNWIKESAVVEKVRLL
jgi:hypothetical protein